MFCFVIYLNNLHRGDLVQKCLTKGVIRYWEQSLYSCFKENWGQPLLLDILLQPQLTKPFHTIFFIVRPAYVTFDHAVLIYSTLRHYILLCNNTFSIIPFQIDCCTILTKPY